MFSTLTLLFGLPLSLGWATLQSPSAEARFISAQCALLFALQEGHHDRQVACPLYEHSCSHGKDVQPVIFYVGYPHRLYTHTHTRLTALFPGLLTDNHASTPPLSYLQAGCLSCRPTNSIKALKAKVIFGYKCQKQTKEEPAGLGLCGNVVIETGSW